MATLPTDRRTLQPMPASRATDESTAAVRQVRRTALLLGLVAIGFYAAFILTTALAR